MYYTNGNSITEKIKKVKKNTKKFYKIFTAGQKRLIFKKK